MRQRLKAKFETTNGIFGAFHLGFFIGLPILVLVLVRVQFAGLALALILLSKWRMFAVKPHYWAANVRANGVDIIVGLAALVFIIASGGVVWQLVWTVAYGAWLVALKSRTDLVSIALQALVAQVAGLLALFLYFPTAPTYALVVVSAAICFLSAHHFFNAFDERYTRLLAFIWAYFGAALTWVLGHWLLFYGFMAQPALILTIIAVSIATIYYLDHKQRLSLVFRRELVMIMVAALIIILVFSKWSGKIV
ncbi:MAG: hypothetical protein ACREGA_05105 [Candidatus Saccharimonadales bacterium]